MNEFMTGDWVEIICRDGARFAGVLDWTDGLVLLNGYGFPHEDVVVMQHA